MKKAAAKKAAPKRHRKQGPAAQPARKARAGKASTSKARAPVAGAKVDVVKAIAAMMARAGGASMDEMVAATGIAAHPMRAKIKLVRDRLGYTTTAPSKDNGHRYFAKPPKAEA